MSTSMTPQTRDQLLRVTAQHHSLADQTFQSNIRLRQALNHRGITEYDTVLNVLEFIYLLQADVAALTHDLALHPPSLRTNLYGRLLILTIHESALTLRGLLAVRFRRSFAELVPDHTTDDALKSAHSRICTLFERSNAMFGAVRDGIVAHRHANADTRVALLQQADVEKVASLAIELLEIHGLLLPLMLQYTRALTQKTS